MLHAELSLLELSACNKKGLGISASGHRSPAGRCSKDDVQSLGAGAKLAIVGQFCSPADSHSNAVTLSGSPDDSWVNKETDVTSTVDHTGLFHSGFCSSSVGAARHSSSSWQRTGTSFVAV